ncbi:hypothetical protein B9Z55_004327 [Caenorhabditis nigoni]|uniref:MPN domain-containing protein n=1 Tax=Caenorhabditis nigoni TaxID=1611254 RepID=A0A2G5UVZ4_9PELO|nr:hypothetical protein B9Z55_004327 [Caenorhabditis nigoni]
MERFLRLGGLGDNLSQFGAAPQDSNQVDTSETVYISSLALLKMLKHGRAGVPMEVMGLMLGEFVDDYIVNVIDVFAMPQSGAGVSVEAVDPVFQAKMLDMLKQTGRPEMVVGWYHSHPGFGCWLSGVDINTQQSFEALSERAVAVVVDPIQSVKGKVVIDAFRTINPQSMALNQEPRQTTSNLGHLQKPSIQRSAAGSGRCRPSPDRIRGGGQWSCGIGREREDDQQVLENAEEGAREVIPRGNQEGPVHGIVTHPDGEETSIPASVLADQFGMAGLVTYLRTVDPKVMEELGLRFSEENHDRRRAIWVICKSLSFRNHNFQALIHGLNRHYYSIPIAYRTHDLEQKMLLNLNKLSWMDAVSVENYTKCGEKNKDHLKAMLKLAKNYKKALEDEKNMTDH